MEMIKGKHPHISGLSPAALTDNRTFEKEKTDTKSDQELHHYHYRSIFSYVSILHRPLFLLLHKHIQNAIDIGTTAPSAYLIQMNLLLCSLMTPTGEYASTKKSSFQELKMDKEESISL